MYGARGTDRRLTPELAPTAALDRLAGLAARLLAAAAAQVTLLGAQSLGVGGAGSRDGMHRADGPRRDSLATATAAARTVLISPDARAAPRVAGLPPVVAGTVGAYLGAPLVTRDGEPVGVLWVSDPEPRAWSAGDVATLEQLASSVVTELELAALTADYEASRLRWDLAIEAAAVGTFDWDLLTPRPSLDDRMRELFGFHDEPMPDGHARWVHSPGRALGERSGTAARLLGAAYDSAGDQDGDLDGEARVAQVLEGMSAAFFSLDRQWRFTYVNPRPSGC